MILFGFMLLVFGTALMWEGPLDPEYLVDWLIFLLGVFLAGFGAYLVIPFFIGIYLLVSS